LKSNSNNNRKVFPFFFFSFPPFFCLSLSVCLFVCCVSEINLMREG
jgi:hypothetical protein